MNDIVEIVGRSYSKFSRYKLLLIFSENSCSFGLLCATFVNVYRCVCVRGVSAPFGFEGGKWNVIVLVLVPVHCLSV